MPPLKITDVRTSYIVAGSIVLLAIVLFFYFLSIRPSVEKSTALKQQLEQQKVMAKQAQTRVGRQAS